MTTTLTPTITQRITRTSSSSEARYHTTTPTAATEEYHTRKGIPRTMSMNDLYITGPDFPKHEAAEVYQEAALNLRYKRITAITAAKLQWAMALLQLEPNHLVERGLAPRSSLAQGLDYGKGKGEQFYSVAAKLRNSTRVVGSSDAEENCPQDLDGIEEEYDGTQNDQDDVWDDYKDDYDSDSDIDDDEDEHDEIEERRKGPIYAFLVYGGVQLRPDEYVLLFRALDISPQYIEQLQCPTSEASQKSHKAPPHSSRAHDSGSAIHSGGGMIVCKASPARGPSSNGRDFWGRFSCRGNIDQRGISERAGQHKSTCGHLSLRFAPNIYHRGGARMHLSTADSSQKAVDLLQREQPTRKTPVQHARSKQRTMVAGYSVSPCSLVPASEQRGYHMNDKERRYDYGRNSGHDSNKIPLPAAGGAKGWSWRCCRHHEVSGVRVREELA